MSSRPLPAAAAIRTVARREVRERTRTTGFRWGTVAMLVVVAGLAVLPAVLPDDDDPEWTVAAVGETPDALAEYVESQSAAESASVELEISDQSPEELLGDGGADAVLVEGEELVSEGSVPVRLHSIVAGAVVQARLVEELAGLGVDDVTASELGALEPLSVRALDDEGDEREREAVAFAGTVVLLMAILTYGAWVMYSVLEEKANRIVEIIVSTIRPSHLLAGKVIGVGIVALAQLVLLAVVGAVVAIAVGSLPEMPEVVPASVGWLLFWFALGFAFYAVLYAAASSLASRQEDAQNAVSPLVFVVIGVYMVSLFVVAPNPDSTAARVVSLIPPFTPLAMPARIASNAADAWEVGLSVVLMVLATWGVTRVAAAIYRSMLLHSGSRVGILTALRRARA